GVTGCLLPGNPNVPCFNTVHNLAPGLDPPISPSFYVVYDDGRVTFNQGCALGKEVESTYKSGQGSTAMAVVLDFGRPAYVYGTWGTRLLGGQFIPAGEVEYLAEQFGYGFRGRR